MKVDLSYAEMNNIVTALNHKIVSLEDEMKRAGPGSTIGMLADMAITNNWKLINKLTDAQNKIGGNKK